MTDQDKVYRRLQKHLDKQPIGFPAARNGADIRILKHIFDPDEARIATCINYRYRSVREIEKEFSDRFGSDRDLSQPLQSMLEKGGIEGIEKEGVRFYCTAPLVVGMYEMQVFRLSPGFIRDFRKYTGSPQFGLSYLSTELPQMRTIPVEKSVEARYDVADFETVQHLLDINDGPYVIVDCICRKKAEMSGHSCRVTDEKETCLAMGNIAQTVLLTGQGRTIDKEEAAAILRRNQKKGLILQPSNSKKAEFICSCCGCCCGILNIHKKLPRPLDYWSAPYTAVVDTDLCDSCGACIKRCQVDAIHPGPDGVSVTVDELRCLGCGQCVSICRHHALNLVRKPETPAPPETREDLHEIIARGKGGLWKKTGIAGKFIFDTLRSSARK